MNNITITSNSGNLSATLYEGSKSETVLIIASATGVKQEYYKSFAQFIASHEISVVTFDYYGIGRSLNKPIEQLNNNAADWGQNDLESIIKYVFANFPNSKKVILGHSIGGQLIGLAENSEKLDKLILVAAQSGYWKHWKGIARAKMWFNWHVLFPIIIQLFGYLNSKKLSGMENLPKNVANQWSNWSKTENYLLGDKSIKQTYYSKIISDLTAFSITDDNFAPFSAVEWMTNQHSNAQKKSIILRPSDYSVRKIGHFGIFKERFKDTIWNQILNEITNFQHRA